jgi:predicted acetyltransferase
MTACLGPDGVQCGHEGLDWFRQECPYVQWVLRLLELPCTGVFVVEVTSFREMERIPSLFGGVCECSWSER